ncbi:M23 family metallopeptidase [Mycobacterium spongiae]|uniref:Peptidoglycan DD-metalloendopeptidase family protein n=1 Tax=Mycobacterium spongiae TaxID=886343 RepID=A0A975JY39_9MYCO|nr:M23 family metallopeptidase [Mycobacterium spongiae]QUR67822.1 peptidoglycan DD-metalloendopeptidase family protein [Mycobacterium spongiae]
MTFAVTRTIAVVSFLALLSVGCGASTDSPAASTTAAGRGDVTSSVVDALTPLIGSVPFAPIPFAGSDGKTHLVYELWVTNFTSADLVVNNVKVLDAGSDRIVGDFAGEAVRQRLQPAGSREGVDHLEPGQSAMVFIHLDLTEDAVPASLVHQVEVTGEAIPPKKNPLTERIGAATVDQRTLQVLSAPVLGQRYIAVDGCCDAQWHTRAVLPINGQASIAQRYAIDYEQADEQGRVFAGDPADPANYAIYGNEVLAVADGTVVDTRNDLPEQTPGSFPTGIPLAEADGNFVVLDIGDGFYVNYAHMQPGSVRPAAGEKVTRGDVIGLVGNTGNTLVPHLHIHVMDGPSPLAAQGLPYLVDRFSITGQVVDKAAFEHSEVLGAPLATQPGVTPTDHTDQLVLDLNIVTFAP